VSSTDGQTVVVLYAGPGSSGCGKGNGLRRGLYGHGGKAGALPATTQSRAAGRWIKRGKNSVGKISHRFDSVEMIFITTLRTSVHPKQSRQLAQLAFLFLDRCGARSCTLCRGAY